MKAPYADKGKELKGLDEIVKELKATILIGVSGQGKGKKIPF